MKNIWLVLLALMACSLALPTELVGAQPLSVGIKVPLELQKFSIGHFYNNLEVTGAYTFGKFIQIESSFLIPVTPLFVSVSAKFFLLTLSPEICYTPLCDSTKESTLSSYLGAGFIYTSVATESVWGFQGMLGLDWNLADWPLTLSFEAGGKFSTFFSERTVDFSSALAVASIFSPKETVCEIFL